MSATGKKPLLARPYLPENPIKHPYDLPPKIPAYTRLYHPSSAGILTASLATFGSTIELPPFVTSPCRSVAWLWDEDAVTGRVLRIIPGRLCVTIVAFFCGFVTFKCLDWARWRTLKSLLNYRGWMYSPTSIKTKLWGITVKILLGPGPHPTYKLQSVLPKQPLPDLDDTLSRWLSVSCQLVSAEEFESTKDAVKCFRETDGPKLQAYLKQKYKKELNWLADYWLTAAYLANRDPIAVNNNYYISTGFPLGEKKPSSLARAASWIYQFARFADFLDNQEFPPSVIQDMIPLCMNGYGYVFGTVRIPGEHMDSILKYNDKHVIIIRNGHYFKLDLYTKDWSNDGKSLLTAVEIEQQLEHICQTADALPDILPVAALTAQSRPIWAKQREILKQNNKEAIQLVESSMFIFCLDTTTPADVHEFCKLVLTGNGSGSDRWYDKCFTGVSFSDAMTGMNVEHSVIDATVFSTVCEYCGLHEHYTDGKLTSDPDKPPRSLDKPQHVTWNLTDLEHDIKVAAKHCHEVAEDLDLCLYDCKYGKGLMKKRRVSPDGYIQMMFQLAYYRLHKQIPKTYEPSTGRMFLLGRTETVHPGSAYSVAWVKAMEDPSVSKHTKQELFRKAVKHQNRFRLDATGGYGCDRHLLGLLCASRELGMDLPRLFMDKAWRAPFVLSTSQTPTRSWEYGTPVNFDCASGGFGPSCKEGYGISYILYGDEKINMAITSWKSGGGPGSHTFASAIGKAMEDTKNILS